MDRMECGCLGAVGHRDHCWPKRDMVGEKGQWCWCSCQPHSIRLLLCDTSTAPLEEQGPYLPCFLTWGSQTLQYSFPRLTASQMLPSVHPTPTEHHYILHTLLGIQSYIVKIHSPCSPRASGHFQAKLTSSVKQSFTSVSPTSLIPSSIFTDSVWVSIIQNFYIALLIA